MVAERVNQCSLSLDFPDKQQRRSVDRNNVTHILDNCYDCIISILLQRKIKIFLRESNRCKMLLSSYCILCYYYVWCPYYIFYPQPVCVLVHGWQLLWLILYIVLFIHTICWTRVPIMDTVFMTCILLQHHHCWSSIFLMINSIIFVHWILFVLWINTSLKLRFQCDFRF